LRISDINIVIKFDRNPAAQTFLLFIKKSQMAITALSVKNGQNLFTRTFPATRLTMKYWSDCNNRNWLLYSHRYNLILNKNITSEFVQLKYIPVDSSLKKVFLGNYKSEIRARMRTGSSAMLEKRVAGL